MRRSSSISISTEELDDSIRCKTKRFFGSRSIYWAFRVTLRTQGKRKIKFTTTKNLFFLLEIVDLDRFQIYISKSFNSLFSCQQRVHVRAQKEKSQFQLFSVINSELTNRISSSNCKVFWTRQANKRVSSFTVLRIPDWISEGQLSAIMMEKLWNRERKNNTQNSPWKLRVHVKSKKFIKSFDCPERKRSIIAVNVVHNLNLSLLTLLADICDWPASIAPAMAAISQEENKLSDRFAACYSVCLLCGKLNHHFIIVTHSPPCDSLHNPLFLWLLYFLHIISTS